MGETLDSPLSTPLTLDPQLTASSTTEGLSSVVHDLTTKVTMLERYTTLLYEDRTVMQKKNDQLSEDVSRLGEDFRSLEKEHNQLQTSHGLLHEEHVRLRSDYAELKQILRELRLYLDAFQADHSKLLEDQSCQKKAQEQLETEVDKLKSAPQSPLSPCDVGQARQNDPAQMTSAGAEVVPRSDDRACAGDTNSARPGTHLPPLQPDLHSLQSDFHNLQSQPQNLQSDPHNLQLDLHNFQSDFQNLQSDFDNLQSDVDPHNLQSDPHNLQSDLHNLQSDLHNLQSDLHNLQSDFHSLQSDVRSLHSDFHNLKSDPPNLPSDFHNLQSDVHNLQSQPHNLQSDLHNNLQAAVAELRTGQGALERAQGSLKAELESRLTAGLAHSRMDEDRFRADLLDLQRGHVETVLAEQTRVEARVGGLVAEVQEVGAELRKVSATLRALDARLGQARELFSACELNLASVKHGDAMTFNTVLVDEGGHYNPTTGVFKAPQPGLYCFTVRLESGSRGSAVYCRLMADCDLGYSLQGDYHGGSGSVLVPLTAGQRVWLMAYNPGRASWSPNGSFRGMLVLPSP